MPVFSEAVLKDSEIADIYAYLQSIPKGKSAHDIELLSRGQALSLGTVLRDMYYSSGSHPEGSELWVLKDVPSGSRRFRHWMFPGTVESRLRDMLVIRPAA